MKKFIFIAIACVCLTACGEKTAEAAKNVGKAAATEAADKIKDEASKAAGKAAAAASKKLHEAADSLRK